LHNSYLSISPPGWPLRMNKIGNFRPKEESVLS